MNSPRYSTYISFFIGCLFLISCNSVIEPDTAERFFFQVDGAELAVQVDGNTSSEVFILLLHGGPGGSGFEYNTGTYSELLEEKYAMVYVDQRGQGASQGKYRAETLTLQRYSDDIFALVKFLKKKYGENISLFLAGHSWGGSTGTHALLHTDVQDYLDGWIEMDGAHDIPLLNQYAVSMFHFYARQEIAAGNRVDEWQQILDFVSEVDSLNVTEEQGGQINSFGGQAEEYLLEAFPQAEGSGASKTLGFMSSPIAPLATLVGNSTANIITPETEVLSLTSKLGQIQIPSLLISGKYDFIVPPRLASSAFERIGTEDKALKIFEKSGHSPMDTEPVAFVQEISAFIEQYK